MSTPPRCLIARIAFALLPLCLAGSASAQMAISVTAESDYRFRGVSLSDEKPSLHLSLGYDGASGWYGGATAATVELEPDRRIAQLLGYAGYAARAASGLGWELGATQAHFDGSSRYDYGEFYGGLNGQGWNARLYYSPSYFGRGVRTAYAELNGGWPQEGLLRLFAHVGALLPLGSSQGSPRNRYDLRLGVSAALVRSGEVQLAWVAASRGGPYPAIYEQKRGALVLSASLFF